MIGWIQDTLHLHTIIDWLTMLSLLVIGGSSVVVWAILWLGSCVERQFRRHDQDLRAEVEAVNKNFMRLLLQIAHIRAKRDGQTS